MSVRFLVLADISFANAVDVPDPANQGNRRQNLGVPGVKVNAQCYGFEDRNAALVYQEAACRSKPGTIFFLYEVTTGMEAPVGAIIAKKMNERGEIINV
jgi:hypothetical protein